MKLTIVSRILSKLTTKARDRAIAIISDFVVPEMSLARACKLSPVGSFELLTLIWTRSHRDKKKSLWSVAKLLQTEPQYYRWQFNQSLIQAARRGDLIVVRWILAHFRNCHISKDVVEEAIRGGHLGVLQILEAAKVRKGIQWNAESLAVAANFRNWGLFHWLYKRVKITTEAKKVNTQLVGIAFEQHNLDQVK